MVADKLFHSRNRLVGEVGAVDDEVASMGEIGDAAHLCRPQIGIAEHGHGIFARDFARVQIAGAALAHGDGLTLVVIPYNNADAFMLDHLIHHAGINALEFAELDFAIGEIEINLGDIAAAAHGDVDAKGADKLFLP